MSFHPRTPQSPSQFSPATSDLTSSMNSSAPSTATTLPTPAHSVNGSASQPSDMSQDIVMGDDSPHKRKRPLEDLGDRDQKKAHIEDSKTGIEALHLDVGEKYLLCQTPHHERLPRITEDLFEMFNLSGIAAEVAREKPNGEKNALRKTYKGQIKKLGILGRFDSVAQDWDAPREKDGESGDKKREVYHGFRELLEIPDAEYWGTRNDPITSGLSATVKSMLNRATTMAKGPLPVKDWDSSVLGDLTPGSMEALRQGLGGKVTAPGTPSATTPNPFARKQQQGPQGAVRPQRTTKKRGYGDNSFEGYGEGFPDDGYSTGDGDDRGGQKRRKKVGHIAFTLGVTDLTHYARITATARHSRTRCVRKATDPAPWVLRSHLRRLRSATAETLAKRAKPEHCLYLISTTGHRVGYRGSASTLLLALNFWVANQIYAR